MKALSFLAAAFSFYENVFIPLRGIVYVEQYLRKDGFMYIHKYILDIFFHVAKIGVKERIIA